MPGGRPRKTPVDSTAVYLVLPDEVLRGYEAWRDEQRATATGAENITTQDVMRSVLGKALKAYQAKKRRR